jgi:hypothetical protein
MVEHGRTSICDGVSYFLRTQLVFVVQCLLIFELIPSVQAQTPEDPNPNSLDYSITNGTINITRYTGSGGDVTIPGMIDGLPVTSIGPMAFQFKRSVTSVAIPESVTSIGYETFSRCIGLRSVTIGDSVTSLGVDAFFECANLAGVYFRGNRPGLAGPAFSDTTATVYYLPGTTGWDATFSDRPTAMWIPVIPDLASTTRDNPPRLLTHSPAPAIVRVQRSVNLRNWEEWQTVTREGGPSKLHDDEAGNKPYRFYRGIEE